MDRISLVLERLAFRDKVRLDFLRRIIASHLLISFLQKMIGFLPRSTHSNLAGMILPGQEMRFQDDFGRSALLQDRTFPTNPFLMKRKKNCLIKMEML